MALSDRTRKLLWGRSGSRCAICRLELTVVAPEVVGAGLVGEECHIVARSQSGPRGSSRLSEGDDSYENLILLCTTPHKLVDDLPEREIIETVHRCCTGYLGNDELHGEREAELVTDFLQEVQDLDIYASLEAGERVRTEFRLTRLIDALEELGLFVFAARVQRTLEINGQKKQPWPVVFVQVFSAANLALHSAHNTDASPDG